MTRLTLSLGTAMLALAMAASPTLAHPSIRNADTNSQTASYEQDRADILAMAGDFLVRFDMQESTPLRAGYQPIDAKISGGHESVRVVEDTGRKIVLQHLLVAEHEGQTFIIKHWRQDWEYEPTRILAYSDRNEWSWQDVPADQRQGRWSQTVYQVDDSPRYSGWGKFETETGVRRWRSNMTWRPLARRDAVRNPVYDRYYGINRHQVTPAGWIHWQDNTKMGLTDGHLEPVVQEYVLNSYTRFSDFNVAAADDYWAKTQGFWAGVRAVWADVASRHGAIRIREEAETGTVIAGRLLQIAEDIREGKTAEAAGLAEARQLITQNTGG